MLIYLSISHHFRGAREVEPDLKQPQRVCNLGVAATAAAFGAGGSSGCGALKLTALALVLVIMIRSRAVDQGKHFRVHHAFARRHVLHIALAVPFSRKSNVFFFRFSPEV